MNDDVSNMIQAVIFDFNGVLVDDEAVHFELFREILAEEGVVITDRDYHERYLGYDDRGCFATALSDVGQAVNDGRLDGLIERKARRYVEVADSGLSFFPFAAETLAAIASRWPVAICSGALRSEIEVCPRAAEPPRSGRRHHRRRGRPQVQARSGGLLAVSRGVTGTPGAVSFLDWQAHTGPGVPGHRRQSGWNRLGQGSRHVGRWHHPYLQRSPAPPVRCRRHHPRTGNTDPRLDRSSLHP